MNIDITDAVCTDSDQVGASVLSTGFYQGTLLTGHYYSGNTFQQGETITLSVTSPSPIAGVVYVWEFWDGSVETTLVPTVARALNRPGQCVWRCLIVDPDGVTAYVTDSICVHAPPQIMEVVVSANSEAVPFNTTVTVYAISPYALPLLYSWTVNGVAQGSTTSALTLAVSTAGTYVIECTVDDDYGGIDTISTTVFGVPNINPSVSPIGQSPVRLRNGVGQTATFFVTAIDPEGQAMAFAWYRNATALSHTEDSEGVQTKSTATFSLASVTPADYTITCIVTDTHGGSATVSLPITVLFNNPPVITSCTRSPASVIGGSPIAFTATATDADLDLLSYSWAFASCSPLPAVTMVGSFVTYTTVAGQAGQTLTGTLTVTDALGKSVSQAIPTTTIT